MLGAIIKNKRLEHNLSQESLCKGICAISYLSKIESGHAVPSEEIKNLLLERLGIEPIERLEPLQYTLERLYEQFNFGDFEAFQEGFLHLPKTLVDTELAVDAHHLYAMASLLKEDYTSLEEHLQKSQSFEAYFSPFQRYMYCYLSGVSANQKKALDLAQDWFNKGQQVKRTGVLLLMAASTEYLMGNYSNAIRLGSEAYELLTLEGNLYYAIAATQTLAAAYSNNKQLETAILLYQRLRHMAHYLKKDDLLSTVYYNLGATYLACKSYDEAYLQFQKLQPSVEGFELREWLMAYQKFILCDIGLKQFGAAREKLKKVNTRLCSDAVDTESSLFLSFKWLNFFMESDAPYQQSEYLEAIRATYEASKVDAHYGFSLFYSEYVIEALKVHRRYKEALEIKESLK